MTELDKYRLPNEKVPSKDYYSEEGSGLALSVAIMGSTLVVCSAAAGYVSAIQKMNPIVNGALVASAAFAGTKVVFDRWGLFAYVPATIAGIGAAISYGLCYGLGVKEEFSNFLFGHETSPFSDIADVTSDIFYQATHLIEMI